MRRLSTVGVCAILAATVGASCGPKDETGAGGGATTTSQTSSTGGTGGGGGGTGASGGSGPCEAAAHPLAVSSTTHDVPDCGSFFMPLNNGTSTVVVFSEQQDPFTIRNSSTEAVTINDITITELGGVQDEEFSYQDENLKPAEFSETTLGPDETFGFYVRFFPVASDERSAKVEITYNGSSKYTFTVLGKGSAGADFLVDPKGVSQYLLGSSTTGPDELTGGMVADAQGNVYISGNSEEAQDELIVARVGADGKLGWAKVFDGPYNIKAVDAGQNGETGGTSGSISLGADGKLYVVAVASWSPSNNSFYTLVAKIEPSDGSLIWSKIWSSLPKIAIASQSSVAYAIDAGQSGRVFVTGGTQGESEVLALALSSTDGSVIFQKRIDVVKGSNDRGYAVRHDGKGNLYIGGQRSGNAGLLVKLTGADGSDPKLAWVKSVGLGTGGNINTLDVDSSGNLYAGLDLRGATTAFGIGSFDANGGKRWMKLYAGNNGDKNNVHVVKVIDGALWAGGRTGPPNFDGQMGDGGLARLALADGSGEMTGFYFNGKGPDELSEHRVKGIALAGDRLLLGVQVYTGTMNGKRFWGYWYQGAGAVEDFKTEPTVGDETGTMLDIATGVSQAVDAQIMNVTFADAPAEIVYQAAQDKTEATPPDGDLMIIQMPVPQ